MLRQQDPFWRLLTIFVLRQQDLLLHLLTWRRSKKDYTLWLLVQRHTPPCQRHTTRWKHEEEVNHAAGAFVRLKRRGPDPAWSVCTHVVSIARGKKSKISFHRPFIPERKARSLKVNKPQQGLRAASDCQTTEKNNRRCEGKKWSWLTKGSKKCGTTRFFPKITLILGKTWA